MESSESFECRCEASKGYRICALLVASGAELRVSFLCVATQELDFYCACITVPANRTALDDGIRLAFVARETWLDGDKEIVLFDQT